MEREKIKRRLRVFAEELFRYLFSKRISMPIVSPPLREFNDSTPTFDPVVGLYILCMCHRKQKEYFKYFEKNLADIIERNKHFRLDKLPSFCVGANYYFNPRHENIWEKILNLASVFLELGVFCSAQGFKQIKYFSSVIWADALYHKYGLNSLSYDDATELVRFASNAFNAYVENNPHICTDQNNRTDIKTESLREYDLWVSELSYRKTVKGELSLDSEPIKRAFVPNLIFPVKILQEDSLMNHMINLVIQNSDPVTSFKLLKILQNRKIPVKLMNNELYLQVMVEAMKSILLKESTRMIMSSLDIFQIANFVMGDKEILATFCYLTVQCVNNSRREDEVLNLISSILGETDKIGNRDPHNVDTSKRSSAKSQSASSKEDDKSTTEQYGKGRILRDFRRTVDQKRDDASKDILKYLKKKTNPLLDKEIFRKLMDVVVKYPYDLWDNVWILSIMKSLDKNIQSKVIIPITVEHLYFETSKQVLDKVKKIGEKFKSPIERNQARGVQKFKERSEKGANARDLSNIFSDLKNAYKRLEKMLDDEKEESSLSEVELPGDKNLEVKAVEPNLEENNSSSIKLIEEEHESVGVKSQGFKKLQKSEQLLLSHDTAQDNIPEKSESSLDLDDKYFDTVNPNEISNKLQNFDALIDSTSQITSSTDSFTLCPGTVAMYDEKKMASVSSKNVIDSVNADISSFISSTPNLNQVKDFLTEMKIILAKKKLDDLDLNKEETAMESCVILPNPTTELLIEFPNSRQLLPDFDESFSTVSLKVIMDAERYSKNLIGENNSDIPEILSISRIENLDDPMCIGRTLETLNSDINNKTLGKTVERHAKLSELEKEVPEFVNLRNYDGENLYSGAQGESSLTISVKTDMDLKYSKNLIEEDNAYISKTILLSSRLERLEDPAMNVKMPENIRSLDTVEESEKVKSCMKLSDLAIEAKDLHDLQSYDGGILSDSGTRIRSSLTANIKADVNAEKESSEIVKDDTEVSKVALSVSKLESLENRMANFKIDENTPNSGHKETDVESHVKRPDFETVPQEFQDLQSYDKGNISCSSTDSQNSLTLQQPLETSDVHRSENILSSARQNKGSSEILRQGNLGSVSSEILSAFRDTMDSLQINHSREVFNEVFQQIMRNNPELIERLKIKFILDKQIKLKLLKYHEEFNEIGKTKP